MKKTILTALITVFALAGCKKEDTSVDVSQLTGTWSYFVDSGDPDFARHNGSKVFSFDGSGGYKVLLRDAYYPDREPKTHEGTYSISPDGRLLTLHEDTDGDFEKQYSVILLNSGRMILQSEDYLTIPFLVYGLPIRTKMRFVKTAW